jgi:hypothetical protein
MASHTIDDPDDAGKKRVAKDGRLFLGEEFEGERVEYAVRRVGDDE